MNNIHVIDKEKASPEAQKILKSVEFELGSVPNIFAAMAQSPQFLESFLSFGSFLETSEFSPKDFEAIDLTVAQVNECDYCLAAHSALAKGKGFSPEEIKGARLGQSSNEKLQSALVLAQEIVKTKGRPDQSKVDAFFEVGYNQKALVELIGIVAKNLMTNYFNHIAGTPLDFPKAEDL